MKVGIMQTMRKFILAVALFLGFIFVVAKLTELQSIAETLQRGIWWFIGLALILEFVWFLNCGASFKAIYRAMGIEEQLGTLSLIVSAANFANVVAPSAGVSGLAIFVSEARRRNYSPARAAVAGGGFLLFFFFGFCCLHPGGFIVSFR